MWGRLRRPYNSKPPSLPPALRGPGGDGLIEEQRQLLSGFKGNPAVDKKLFQEAMDPKHVAISLDGEPTIYPYLSDLIKLIKRMMAFYLLSNGGLFPIRIPFLTSSLMLLLEAAIILTSIF